MARTTSRASWGIALDGRSVCGSAIIEYINTSSAAFIPFHIVGARAPTKVPACGPRVWHRAGCLFICRPVCDGIEKLPGLLGILQGPVGEVVRLLLVQDRLKLSPCLIDTVCLDKGFRQPHP